MFDGINTGSGLQANMFGNNGLTGGGFVDMFLDIVLNVRSETIEGMVVKGGEQIRPVVTNVVNKHLGELYTEEAKKAVIDFICKYNKEGLVGVMSDECSKDFCILVQTMDKNKLPIASAGKSILAEVGEAAAEAKTMIKPKPACLAIGGIGIAAVINMLTAGKVAADSVYTEKTTPDYKKHYNENEFENAIKLFTVSYNPVLSRILCKKF